ncbi:murein transglycosylase [Vibrio zhugei]|uniref:Murein transglycosylase n=1 Tax=Vibrio zhugei TaxID=2479546 RepID=A0ABV7C8V4_9VIBR|nr:murein transglycosylase [Vibrio zhugei]
MTLYPPVKRKVWVVFSLFMMNSVASVNAYAQPSLDKQRELYEQAQDWLDNDQVSKFKRIRNQLVGYPLTPYLDYRSLLVDIGDKSPVTVRAFIDSHREFPFSRRISAPYLSALADQKKWKTFLAFQTDEPSGQTYRCHYYYAKLKTGQTQAAMAGAKKLWLSGQSISDACDGLFEQWTKSGLRTDELVYQRIILAFKAHQPQLMQYLIPQLSTPDWQTAGQAVSELYDDPENAIAVAKRLPDLPHRVQVLTLALKKLAIRDPEQAKQELEQGKAMSIWSKEQAQALASVIAAQLLDSDDRELIQWRDRVISHSQDVGLIGQRIRFAIRHADWKGVKAWISLLPKSSQKTLRWQFWQARSDMLLGDQAKAKKHLQTLLGKRDFYSVAAAKLLNKPVTYPTSTLKYQSAAVKDHQATLTRIDELIQRDKIAAAKSEWSWLLMRVPQKTKTMLAAYALKQHWYHLTVSATISAKLWDYIELRFPLAHQWWFEFYGEKNNIEPFTLMSVARQESALDSEAHSPVGARGIMQIMPATARHTASKYQLDYSNAKQLYDVGKNIEIGSRYFESLMQRYDNNRILALAAYNAGPSRVTRWRDDTQQRLGPFAFIEAIPFKETRGYVQNILMFENYYRRLAQAPKAFLRHQEMKAKY